MAKKLNKRVVIGLSLVSFSIILFASFLMLRRLQSRDPVYYITKAETYADDGDFKTAALFYKEAWERSQDPAHLVAQGEMMLELGEVGRALGIWRVAIVNQPDYFPAHRKILEVQLELANLYGLMGDWSAVETTAVQILEVIADLQPVDTAVANNAKGLALIRQGRDDQEKSLAGEDALLEAIRLAPQNVTFALDLVDTYVRTDRLGAAEEAFDRLLRQFNTPGVDSSKVHVGYAQLLIKQSRFQEAEKIFEEALRLAGDNVEALHEARLSYAMALSREWAQAVQRKESESTTDPLFVKTENMLKACMSSNQDDFKPYLFLSHLYNSAARYEEVLVLCEKRLDLGFARSGIEATRHRLSAFTLMLYAAESSIMIGANALTDGNQKLRTKMLAQAEQYVVDARGEFPNHPAVPAHQGRIKLARGEDRGGLEELRRADEGYQALGTIHWDTKLLLARVHLRLNEPGAARRVLEGVIDQAQRERSLDLSYWSLLARSLLETNQLDRAQSISDQILMVDVNNTEALRIRAIILNRQGRQGEAVRVVRSMTDDPILRTILQARQETLGGSTEQALTILREALQENPTELRLVGALVKELVALNRTDEAHQVVRQAQVNAPHDVSLKRLALATDTSQSEEQRDRALLQTIEDQEDDYQRALELIGYYWGKDQYDQTLRYIEVASNHLLNRDTPLAQNAAIDQHRSLLTFKMFIADKHEDQDALVSARDEAVKYNVDGAGGQALVGLFYLHRREYDRAVNALRKAVSIQSTDAHSLARLGQSLQLLGQSSEARDWYEKAVQVNPREVQAYKGLAVLAKQDEDTAAYDMALDKCQELAPHDPWVIAALLERQEEVDPVHAIAQRVERLTDHPDDLRNLLKLAQLSETVGDLDQADIYYEKLAARRPDDKNVAVTIGKYYRRTDRPERALRYVRRYIQTRLNHDDRATAHILLAAHYMELQQTDQAEQALLTAADLSPTLEVTHALTEFYMRAMDDPEKALPWLREAVSLARPRDTQSLTALIGSLVTCLLDRRVDRVQEAREVLDDLRANYPDYQEALKLEARYFARVGKIERAIDALTDYLALVPDDARALYRLALHHCSLGKFDLAVDDLGSLKRVHPDALELRPRLLLAKLHQRAGRIDIWLHELERLVEDSPDKPEPVEALALAYIHQKRLADAQQLIVTQINRNDGESDSRWLFLRGRLMLALDQPQQALLDFQKGAKASGFEPAAVSAVLDTMLQLQQYQEGLVYFRENVLRKDTPAFLLSRYAKLLALAGKEQEAVDQFRRAMSVALATSDLAVRQVSADLSSTYTQTNAIPLFEANPPKGLLGQSNDRIMVRLYRSAGRFEDALATLQPLIDSSGDPIRRADLLAELGDVNQASGNWDQAQTAYIEALKYHEERWITLNNLAYLLSDKLGEHRKARAYAERAVQLSDSSDALDTLGWIYVGLEEYSKAIAELSRAIRIHPDEPLTYYHLGEAYRRQGRFDQAAEILQSGRKLALVLSRNELVVRLDASLERVVNNNDTPLTDQ